MRPSYLFVTLLGSILLHAAVLVLPSGFSNGSATFAKFGQPRLQVLLASGKVPRGESFLPAKEPSEPIHSVSRKSIFPGMPPVSQGEEADSSIYADPNSIEQIATVIDAPELPLPPDSDTPSGLLRMKIFVSDEGVADQIELLETSFLENYTTRLIDAFRESKFSPGMLDGRAIKSWRIVEINYTAP